MFGHELRRGRRIWTLLLLSVLYSLQLNVFKGLLTLTSVGSAKVWNQWLTPISPFFHLIISPPIKHFLSGLLRAALAPFPSRQKLGWQCYIPKPVSKSSLNSQGFGDTPFTVLKETPSGGNTKESLLHVSQGIRCFLNDARKMLQSQFDVG